MKRLTLETIVNEPLECLTVEIKVLAYYPLAIEVRRTRTVIKLTVKVPSMKILTGRPFHKPLNPILP